MQAARAQALREYSRAYRIKTDAARFAAAEEALAKQDVEVAYRLYLRVASAQNTAPQTLQSRQRLEEIRRQGETQLQRLEGELPSIVDALKAASFDFAAQEAAELRLTAWQEEFHGFVLQYGDIDAFTTRINTFLRKQQKEYGATLNEPEARRLLAAAQALEGNGELCCAFYVYEQAVALRPAAVRYGEVVQRASIVAAAEQCRKLQWCHDKFQEASRLVKDDPAEARSLFFQVVQRSPADSTVHIAAREQLAALR
jgi:hypothetical protein